MATGLSLVAQAARWLLEDIVEGLRCRLMDRLWDELSRALHAAPGKVPLLVLNVHRVVRGTCP